jgi:MFS family permease
MKSTENQVRDNTWPIAYFIRHDIYYGWVIVAVMFITLFFSLGFRFAFGVYYSAILDETGWQRGETASVVSAAMVVYAATAALSGFLYDRLGARVLFPIGALLMGLGLILCAGAATLTHLIIAYGVLLGLSYAALGFIPHMAIVPRWFTRRRGLASAVALAGVGLGSLVISAASAALILRIGWRQAMWVFGIASMAVLIPLNLVFHRHSAEAVGLTPDGTPGTAFPHSTTTRHTPVRAALISPVFWLLFMAVTMIGLCTMVMVVHQTRLLVDMGFNLSLASLLFGLMGVTRSVGGLFWGPLSDRIGRGACVIIICTISVIGLGMLLAASWLAEEAFGLRLLLLVGYLGTFGIGYNGMSPVYASTVSDHFSGKNLGTILGLLDLGFGLGSALGPWWAGWMFDAYGSYTGVILGTAAGVVLTGIGLAAAAQRPVH